MEDSRFRTFLCGGTTYVYVLHVFRRQNPVDRAAQFSSAVPDIYQHFHVVCWTPIVMISDALDNLATDDAPWTACIEMWPGLVTRYDGETECIYCLLTSSNYVDDSSVQRIIVKQFQLTLGGQQMNNSNTYQQWLKEIQSIYDDMISSCAPKPAKKS